MKSRRISQTLYGFASTLLLAFSVLGMSSLLMSCHDEPPFGPDVPDEENTRMITFSLPENHYSFSGSPTPVVVSLISLDGSTQVYEAVVDREAGMLHFQMILPEDGGIADGKYIMTLRHADGQSISGRLSCLFEKERLSAVNIILPTYMLDGSGTEEDPYIIATNSDFEMFLINLSDDTESFGAGLKFLQTGDVVAPDQSSVIAGRGYWGSPFAGIYDGGGHAITGLYYHGSNRESSDVSIGVFQNLLGSATIEHLTLSGVSVSGIYKESGMLAGGVSGDVAISDVAYSGHIDGGSSLGGLVGIVKSGTLTLDNINISSATVSGDNSVGGLVGKVNNGARLAVSNISTHHFSVAGKGRVGGLAGEVAGAATFKKIRIDHKVTNEDSDLRIVSGAGEGVGGIIGAVTNNPKGISLLDCYVLAPLGGEEASGVGGLVGAMDCKGMSITNCKVYSVVAGKTYVGGLIGKATMPSLSDGLTISGEDYSTRVTVDDADASVSGTDHVGGLFGWWEGPLKLESKIKMNVPVTSTGSSCGGAFGCLYNSSFDATRVLIGPGGGGANTLHISGNKEVGGLIGKLWKSTLTSDSGFDFVREGDKTKIPSTEGFTPAFDGVVTGTETVGGIVGYGLVAQIRGVFSTAHITGNLEVGGISGKAEDETYNSSNIEDCTFKGILNCPAADRVGGIVGHYRSVGAAQVHDCVNYSDIEGGDSDGGTAGIIGYISKAKPNDDKKVLEVKWCANVGKINGGRHVGGIVGRAHAEDASTSSGPCTTTLISISDCVNTGSVYAEGGSSSSAGVGGILGFSNYLTGVYRCGNHGEVYGHEACHGIGGISGSMGQDPTGAGLTTHYRNVLLQQSINRGTVNAGTRSSFVGGILGYQEEGEQSNLEDCANYGTIPPKQDHDSGGILGCADHLTYIYRCVNKGKVEHGNATIGTHKSGSVFHHDYLYFLEGTGGGWPSATKLRADLFTVEYQYKGFDFTNVWKMTSEGPILKNNPWNYI